SGKIAEKIREDPYRILVCADKFQTGYDEPLLHTMYVDKTLSGIRAVQTLSRLNRAHPKKHDVFILDFLNDVDTIRDSFADYYRTTILADETDPNKLHDLQADLDGAQVYSMREVDDFVERYLGGAERDQLDPILDACIAVYLNDLDEDGQVDFKGKAKAFTRTYGFLSSILPYTNAAWEKRSIFLNFLVSKLPAPQEEDLSKGILDAIDMESYRLEKRAMQRIFLPDQDAEIGAVPVSGGGHLPEPEVDRLSTILSAFNDLFGNIQWLDADRVRELITETIPSRVAEDTAYQNAQRNSDKQNARIEHDKALMRVMTAVMKDDTELFKQFMDNEGFKRWMTDTSFFLTYLTDAADGARASVATSPVGADPANQARPRVLPIEEGPFEERGGHVPFYEDIAVAAGSFGVGSAEGEQTGWVHIPWLEGRTLVAGDWLAVRIQGDSMEPVIPDGSIQVFRKYGPSAGGTRQGKVMLIGYLDPDSHEWAYVVKRYRRDGGYKEREKGSDVVVRLESTNPSHPEVVLTNVPESDIRTLAFWEREPSSQH
ncbi:hypothetical protein IIA16_02935, partial [bacterium]|nr:hypothetical protein [bacterium]